MARTRGHDRPHRRRGLALRGVRGRLPLLHREEPQRPVSRATCSTCPSSAPSACSSSSVTVALGVARARARRRRGAPALWLLLTVAARRDLPRRHRARVVPADLTARAHDRHQPVRHHVLLAGGPARLARDRRARHARRSAASSPASGALRPAHAERVEMVSWYWHFVDAVWVVVFTVVYVIGR